MMNFMLCEFYLKKKIVIYNFILCVYMQKLYIYMHINIIVIWAS